MFNEFILLELSQAKRIAMPIVEIITIGTELLLGDVQDTNTRFIARNLKETGYDVFRISTVGDNQARIAQLILEAINRSDIVITTGGLGPTVDDPTREAVAQAFNTHLIFHEELWKQIEDRFAQRGSIPTENNRKQAMLPVGSIAIENKYGTAPGILLPVGDKLLVCLQGVPHEMEHLLLEDVLPFLKTKFPPTRQLATKVLHTIGIGESTLDNLIGEFEKMENPTVGLIAHSGIVDIRLVASASTTSEAFQIISRVEQQIRNIVPEFIFGEDEETIEKIISKLACNSPKNIVVRLVNFPLDFQIEIPNIDINMASDTLADQQIEPNDMMTIIFSNLDINNQKQVVINMPGQSKITRTFLGPSQSFFSWARNIIFYYIWLRLINISK